MAIKKNKPSSKICPFIDRECPKDGCMLYHADFDKCMLDILQYNLYILKKAIQEQD
jgi:hypothetical protein